MNIVIIVAALVVLVFGFVVFFGAPFLPTRKPQAEAAFELLDLKKGQTLLELGSGDGRMLRMAAQRGIKAVGYEINPLLVIFSRLATLRYKRLVTIRWSNYWTADWPKTDGIYTFLLDKYMVKLDQKVSKQKQPLKLASYAFKIPGKKPNKQKSGIFLYVYK